MEEKSVNKQINAAKKQLLLQVAELLVQQGLISREEKNIMKTIIYRQE